MDLLECMSCDRRFLIKEAGQADGWRCPGRGHELRLVARSLPGTPRQIEKALGAQHLTPRAEARV